jgi:hypothetical protein
MEREVSGFRGRGGVRLGAHLLAGVYPWNSGPGAETLPPTLNFHGLAPPIKAQRARDSLTAAFFTQSRTRGSVSGVSNGPRYHRELGSLVAAGRARRLQARQVEALT